MFEENLALLRTHHKNVQRYRQLLESSLTDFERKYIGKRLLEEQLAIQTLSANAPSEATPLVHGRRSGARPTPIRLTSITAMV